MLSSVYFKAEWILEKKKKAEGRDQENSAKCMCLIIGNCFLFLESFSLLCFKFQQGIDKIHHCLI